jgi:hypothetical protein
MTTRLACAFCCRVPGSSHGRGKNVFSALVYSPWLMAAPEVLRSHAVTKFSSACLACRMASGTTALPITGRRHRAASSGTVRDAATAGEAKTFSACSVRWANKLALVCASVPPPTPGLPGVRRIAPAGVAMSSGTR